MAAWGNRNVAASGSPTWYVPLRSLSRGPSPIFPDPLTTKQIRSVWKNPDLGGLIRHLSLNLFGDEQKQPSNIRKRYYVYGSASWNKESLAQAVRRFLGRNMEKMPVPSSIPVWCQRSLIPVFLLLAMARNLEHLSLSVSRYWNLDGVMRTSQTPGQAIIPRVKLPNLQSLEMWLHEGYDINLSNNHMRAIVHLFLAVAPGLTTLQLRGFPRLLNLPPLSDLQHLVLVNTHLSQQSLFALTSAAPALKHLCTLFYGDHPLPAAARLEPDFDGANADLITSRLHLLSHSPLAATLRTVVFSDYMLSDIAVPSIPLFVNLNLTVLGVRYLDYDNGNCGSPVSLIVLLRGCPSLRGLLITGAFRMGSTGLRQFADAVAAGDFPSLRRVKLVARKSYWKKLAKIAKAPVPARFKAAGVEFEIGLHELEGTAGLVREMEEAVLG